MTLDLERTISHLQNSEDRTTTDNGEFPRTNTQINPEIDKPLLNPNSPGFWIPEPSVENPSVYSCAPLYTLDSPVVETVRGYLESTDELALRDGAFSEEPLTIRDQVNPALLAKNNGEFNLVCALFEQWKSHQN